jgi:hypothetical protein
LRESDLVEKPVGAGFDLTGAEAEVIAAKMTEEILRACPDFFNPSPSEPEDSEIPF